MKLLFLVFATEIIFILGASLARLYLMDEGNFFELLFRPWLWNYLFLLTAGTLLMMYVLKTQPILKAITLLSGTGLIMATLSGWLWLGEPLDVRDGCSFAFVLISMYLLYQDKKKKK